VIYLDRVVFTYRRHDCAGRIPPPSPPSGRPGSKRPWRATTPASAARSFAAASARRHARPWTGPRDSGRSTQATAGAAGWRDANPPTQDCVLGRKKNGEDGWSGSTGDRHAAASTAGAANEAAYDKAGLQNGPGVPRVSRRLRRPRHPGGAGSRALHSRLRTRPETQSRVGLLSRQELVEQAMRKAPHRRGNGSPVPMRRLVASERRPIFGGAFCFAPDRRDIGPTGPAYRPRLFALTWDRQAR
jgi:hypothetical protein